VRRLPPRLLNGGLINDHPTPLGGTCSARFDHLRELLAAKLESGEDLGASVAVNLDGEMVVDLWGGWADEARTVPRTEHTITNVFSTAESLSAAGAAFGRPGCRGSSSGKSPTTNLADG
jgi:hypothetical protein